MKNSTKVLLLLLLVVIIAIVPLATIKDSEFGGADDQASEIIESVEPGYEPWADPLFEPPGGETESLLFALQAAIGAGIIGAGFGYFKGRKDGISLSDNEKNEYKKFEEVKN